MPKSNGNADKISNHPHVVARETPNSYEAEVALLGGMLIDGQTASNYMPELTADDFYTPAHRYVYEALAALFSAAKPIDFVTVVGELEKSGTLELTGGVDYISKMVSAVPSVANSQYYFEQVKKMARLRSIIEIAKKMADTAYALDPDDQALQGAEAALYGLAESTRRGKPERIDGFVRTVLDDIKQRSRDTSVFRGVPTGFPKLDSILGGGFQKSDLIILAARPGQGKTSFAMNCAVNAALRCKPDDGKPYSVAVFSLEMSATQLAKRILCSVGQYDMSRANRGVINESEWDRLYAARDELVRTNLYIDETGNITPAEILSKCRALKRTHGLDFVMIDYLQLMQSGKRVDNFVREIAEITRALKLAAKELSIPVLLLSQMSRSIEQRKGPDKESKLSDLRDSGAIEQDADIVLFIDRKEQAQDKSAPSDVYLNIAKHRNGQTGNIKLIWNPSTTTFSSPDERVTPDEPKYYSGRDAGFEDNAPPPEPYDAGDFEPPFDIDDNGDGDDGDDGGSVDELAQQAIDSGLLDGDE